MKFVVVKLFDVKRDEIVIQAEYEEQTFYIASVDEAGVATLDIERGGFETAKQAMQSLFVIGG